VDRTEKENVVAELSARLKGVAGVFLADFRGLTVLEVHELRKLFRKAQVEYQVVKNTLVKRAIAGTPLEALKEHLKGTTALAIAKVDAVGAAKAALDFAKTNEKFKVKVAFVEGQTLLADGIKALSSLPSQSEMRAILLGMINTPAAKLMAQFNAPAQNLVGVLQAKVEKDEKAAA